MKKIFLILFLWLFLFSCSWEKFEKNENTNSLKNISKNEEKVANFKISADLVANFEVEYLVLDLNLILKSGHNFLNLKDFIEKNSLDESWKKDFEEYKKVLDDKKSEILKNFPEIEKNLTSSDEKINWVDFEVMFQAFTKSETKENPENKITVKVEWNYNPFFKWNFYNFPFYQYYWIIKQEPMSFSELLLVKNIWKNKYFIEKTEKDFFDFTSSKSLMVGYLWASNHTFNDFPDKIFIDLENISKIYEKYLWKEKNIFTLSFLENEKEIEKITYNDWKNLDLNDEKIYFCEKVFESEKNCKLDLLKISKNKDFVKNLTIYIKK